MSSDDQELLPAWDDPVHDAQLAFRCVLKALSEPGVIQTLPMALQAPAPLDKATAAVCLSLMDFETPVWLADDVASDAVRAYLRFHCGLPLVKEPSQAAFAVLRAPLTIFSLEDFAQGSMAYPDKSATLLIQVSDLDHGPARVISGPGIRDKAAFCVSDLPEDFVSRWQHNHLMFPMGVDVIFCCGNAVLGLPRTTRLQHEEVPCMSQ